MKKVIFLDIDGVLNSGFRNEKHQKEIGDGALIDQEKIELLAGLVEKTDAGIILHSGWRFWFERNGAPLRPEAGYLVKALADAGLKISGMTPDLTTAEIRKTKKFSLVKADEILMWLKMHHHVSGWVVLDDLALYDETVAAHQVKTDPAIGLTSEDIAEAERILEEKSII
ncbi:MAG: hypothetical protein HFI48_14480 [Lachnospiraceae bacterium]|nr:hypothetical protein [Lachnospiraceae bacterium]